MAAGQRVVKYGLRMPTEPVVIPDDDPARATLAADADAAYAAHRAGAEQATAKLNALPLANLTIPARIVLFAIVVGIAAAAGYQATTGSWSPPYDGQKLSVIGGGALAGDGRVAGHRPVRGRQADPGDPRAGAAVAGAGAAVGGAAVGERVGGPQGCLGRGRRRRAPRR